MANYIKGTTLNWPQLWGEPGMSKDNGGRWEATAATPKLVREYLGQFRSPSRAWPLSHAKPLLTQKFARVMTEQDPELAIKCGVAQ